MLGPGLFVISRCINLIISADANQQRCSAVVFSYRVLGGKLKRGGRDDFGSEPPGCVAALYLRPIGLV